jgi:hypothetical protein
MEEPSFGGTDGTALAFRGDDPAGFTPDGKNRHPIGRESSRPRVDNPPYPPLPPMSGPACPMAKTAIVSGTQARTKAAHWLPPADDPVVLPGKDGLTPGLSAVAR